MRLFFSALLLCMATLGFSQEKQTDQKNKLEAQASFSINSNGLYHIRSERTCTCRDSEVLHSSQ